MYECVYTGKGKKWGEENNREQNKMLSVPGMQLIEQIDHAMLKTDKHTRKC